MSRILLASLSTSTLLFLAQEGKKQLLSSLPSLC
jgi:hypothetical protein